MTHPTRYYLEWNDGDEDTTRPRQEDIPGAGESAYLAAVARAHELSQEVGTVVVYRRTHIADVTPTADPPGLIWDWDWEYVTDVTA